MSSEQSEEEQIKDYLTKLSLLTKALVEEKNKSKNYLDKIKEYEQTLQKKDNEIEELNKEKFSLKSKLTLEKSKQTPEKNESIFTSIYNKFTNKPIDKEKINKLEQTLEQQKINIKELTRNLMEENENYEQNKLKLQTTIQLKNNEIKELGEKIKNMQKDNDQLSNNSNDTDLLLKKFESEKQLYEEKYIKLQKENKQFEEKSLEVSKRLTEYQRMNEDKERINKDLRKKVDETAQKINEVKIQIDRNLEPKKFKVERVKDNVMTKKKLMDFTFRRSPRTGKCEILIVKPSHKGLVEIHINLLDLQSFKINEKIQNQVDIAYNVRKYFFNFIIFFILGK